MEEIYDILQNLNTAQLRNLKTFLSAFSSSAKKEIKTLQLLAFLLKQKEAPDMELCSQKIFNCPADNKIRKLKSRLKAKIEEALLLELNLDKSLYSDRVNAIIAVKKKLVLFNIFFYTLGYKPFLKKALDDLISISKKYEYYFGVLEGLRLKKLIEAFREGLETFKEMNENILFYERCLRAQNKAVDANYLYVLKSNFTGKANAKMLQRFLYTAILELKEEYEVTCSAEVGYYLKSLELKLYGESKNYPLAIETLREQKAIIEKNVSVYSKARVGSIYDNIAQYQILLGDYISAQENLLSGKKYFEQSSSNYYINLKIYFEALFYSGDFLQAKKVTEELIKSTKDQVGNFRLAQYEFFRANIFFQQEDYRACVRQLNKRLELSKDKAGWEISIRVLLIMSLIELEKYDDAALQIENLYRHKLREKQGAEVNERDKLIVKILKRLEHCAFRNDELHPRIHEKYLKLSKNKDEELSWEPLTHELIPFHQWLAKRFNKLIKGSPVKVEKKKLHS